MRAPVGSWAVAASALAHGCAVALMLLRFQAEPSGAAAAGVGGIVASLGPMGGAPGGEVTATAPELEEVEAVEPVETVDAVEAVEPVETVEAAEPVETVDATEVAPPVEPTVSPAEPVEAEAVPPVEAVETVERVAEAPVVAMTELEPPREIVPPPPAPVKPEAPRLLASTASPPPKSLAAIAPAAEAKPDPAPVPPQVAGVGGRSGTRSAPDAGSGESVTGGGQPGADPGYLAILSAWLEQHKEYPRRAQLRRQEGTATLRFVIDRKGRVLSFEIVKSSGYPALDREVKAMIQRASPVPAMPDNMQQAELELVVPVAFKLR